LELRPPESAERGATGAEEHKPVALRFARLLVGDDAAVLELTEARERGAEVVGAGSPPEAMYEQLPARRVGLRRAPHGRHRGGARLRSRAEQRHELLPRQRLEQLPDVLHILIIFPGDSILLLLGDGGLGRVVVDGEIDGAAGLGFPRREFGGHGLRGGGGIGRIGLSLLRRHREAS
jgi:hypothetical protein